MILYQLLNPLPFSEKSWGVHNNKVRFKHLEAKTQTGLFSAHSYFEVSYAAGADRYQACTLSHVSMCVIRVQCVFPTSRIKTSSTSSFYYFERAGTL